MTFGVNFGSHIENMKNAYKQLFHAKIDKKIHLDHASNTRIHYDIDVASDVGVNLCNVKSCLNTSNNEIFTDKRGDLPSVSISKHTCPVVK